MLRNMQGKFDITKNPNTKMMINKLKKDVAQTESKNHEIYLKY